MKTWSKVLLSLCYQALFLLVVLQGQEVRSGKNELAVSVTLGGVTAGDIELLVTLENRSQKALHVFNADLPWLNYEALRVIVVPDRPEGVPIKQNFYPGSPVTGDLTIEPAKSVSGRIKLSDRFPELKSIFPQRRILIFWAYSYPVYALDDSRVLFGNVLAVDLQKPINARPEPTK